MKNDFGINTDLFTFVLRVKLKEKTCLCSFDRTVRLYVRLTSSENECARMTLSFYVEMRHFVGYCDYGAGVEIPITVRSWSRWPLDQKELWIDSRRMSVVLYMYRRQYDENEYSIYMSFGTASTQFDKYKTWTQNYVCYAIAVDLYML